MGLKCHVQLSHSPEGPQQLNKLFSLEEFKEKNLESFTDAREEANAPYQVPASSV